MTIKLRERGLLKSGKQTGLTKETSREHFKRITIPSTEAASTLSGEKTVSACWQSSRKYLVNREAYVDYEERILTTEQKA